MFDPDEMKRLRFFEALRFAIAFAAAMAVIAAVAFGCPGCATGPYGIYIDKTVWVYVTNRVDSAAGGVEVAPDSDTAAESASSTAADEVALDFRYGGFKGGNAKEDSRCRLGSPKIAKDKISWKWLTKIPSDWKRQDTGKGQMVIAAAFYLDGNKWVGGKMDFCNESRSSRSAENIHAGYNGWNASAWNSAKKRAFCVVSADGKWRSNLIED